nr:MAG TPA: hypothetical protein [Caudoviricetes sp.]
MNCSSPPCFGVGDPFINRNIQKEPAKAGSRFK